MSARSFPVERPRIGISTSEMRLSERVSPMPEGEPVRREMTLGMVYVDAVFQAGGLPVILPPLTPAFAAALVDELDGLCIPGGPDIHPSLYGHEAHEMLGPTDAELDAFERALVIEALDRDLPLLGICRGAQMINVAAGGTLHQHLPACVDGALAHRQELDIGRATHAVRVASGSALGAALGREALQVNSLHHQAVDRLGDGVRAAAWAPDGVVEAIEGVGDGFLLGVQWHAEALLALPEERLLLSAFVEAAAGRLEEAGVAEVT